VALTRQLRFLEATSASFKSEHRAHARIMHATMYPSSESDFSNPAHGPTDFELPEYLLTVRRGSLKRAPAMKFGVAAVCQRTILWRQQWPRPSESDTPRIVHLVLLSGRVCKLDMEQHYKWMVHGADGLRGRGCTRMRPKLHLPALGHAAFRVTGVLA
jgi:hypothetical protein